MCSKYRRLVIYSHIIQQLTKKARSIVFQGGGGGSYIGLNLTCNDNNVKHLKNMLNLQNHNWNDMLGNKPFLKEKLLLVGRYMYYSFIPMYM